MDSRGAVVGPRRAPDAFQWAHVAFHNGPLMMYHHALLVDLFLNCLFVNFNKLENN